MNLETGLREAKLLENTGEKSSSNDLIPVSTDDKEQEKISRKNLERAFANLNLTKDDVPTDKVKLKIIINDFFYLFIFCIET